MRCARCARGPCYGQAGSLGRRCVLYLRNQTPEYILAVATDAAFMGCAKPQIRTGANPRSPLLSLIILVGVSIPRAPSSPISPSARSLPAARRQFERPARNFAANLRD